MDRGVPPPAEKVRELRATGKSYRWIADRYGIPLEVAYLLAHAHELREDQARDLDLLQDA